MRLLAFDTSTERLSIAVAVPGAAPRCHDGDGGAKASATLVPRAMELLGQASVSLASLDAIVFGSGPGSFTGLRTACAVAQGLALGAEVPVLAVETLMAVAEVARARTGATQVVAVLDARMDEVYTADYRWTGAGWQRLAPIRLAAPGSVAPAAGWVVAGNAFDAYPGRLPVGDGRIDAWPDASALLRLAPGLLAAGLAARAAAAGATMPP